MKSKLRVALAILAVLSLGVYSAPILIVKKTIPRAEPISSPSPLEIVDVTPEQPLKQERFVAYIHSSNIPYSKPQWKFNGVDLRSHISITHGIEYERMKYLNQGDLVRLHSYLHNGGSL